MLGAFCCANTFGPLALKTGDQHQRKGRYGNHDPTEQCAVTVVIFPRMG